jgi:N-acetylglucosaminyldiphosphoundecaprenol N-acetyl-beta-D-mannosaminyltransferase
MEKWPDGKFLIATVNTHSFVLARHDRDFAQALLSADALLPDGIGIVWAGKWLRLKDAPQEKIAGADLFRFEMERLEEKSGTCFFLGSSPEVLSKIKEKAALTYPDIRVSTFSPPYKEAFSREENQAILQAIRDADPDLLWVGMTAPKQEKWLHDHWQELDIHCHAGAIGAVFDFFAGTVERAPAWWIDHGLEWLYRFIRQPGRMWRRIFVSGPVFFWSVCRETFLTLFRRKERYESMEAGKEKGLDKQNHIHIHDLDQQHADTRHDH